MYRLQVKTSDGQTATVTWQIDTHRVECRKYVLRDISQRLRVDSPEMALEVLTSWTKERLVAHLSTFTKHDLRPPAMRHGNS